MINIIIPIIKSLNNTLSDPRGGFPYETYGDARRLAWGCKFFILVSLRVFRAKGQYFKPPRSRLGFREETQNYKETMHEHDEELEIYDNAFKNYFR